MPLSVNIEMIVKGRVSPDMYDRAGVFLRRSPVAQNFMKRIAAATSTNLGDWEYTIIPKPMAADLPPVPTADEVAKGRDETRKQTLKHFSDARARVQEHCRRTGATGGGDPVDDLGADGLPVNTEKQIRQSRKSRGAPGPRRDGGLFACTLKPTTQQ